MTLEQTARETVNTIIQASTVVTLPSTILSAAMALDIAINESQNHNEGALIPVTEVNFMDLTPEAVQLAHAYMQVVEEQERADFTRGYTPEELDRQRTRIHNKFLDALKGCRIDTSHRASTTDLARRIVQWMPD